VQLLDFNVGIDFSSQGNLREFSPVGFSPLSDDASTWSEQATAGIAFRVPPLRNNLHLTVDVFPFIAEHAGVSEQECWIYLNGLFVQFSRVRERAELSFDLPRDQLALRANRLAFVMPHAASPSELGIGNDIRRLGLAFSRLTVHQ
jgi:hypothetical protein